MLGLYNSAGWQTLEYNPLRTHVEMVLNYLGLKLEYHDIARGLPTAEQMQPYRGVVIWFGEPRIENARAYWSWLGQQLRRGKRVVMLNMTGPRTDAATGHRVPLFSINRQLRPMGLVVGADNTDLPLDIELVSKDPEMVEFERRLETEMTRFTEIRSVGDENEVFLRVRMKSTGATSDAVVITPGGGLVAPGYLCYEDPDTEKEQWRINPFAFFSRALGVTDSPRPDCTTLNGARIFYSHIDGDGLVNPPVTDRGKISAETIFKEVLEAHPDLPVTVSVIVVEVEKGTRGSDRSIEVARKIFRLPNVEPASHTYSHPLIWSTELVPASHLEYYAGVMSDVVLSGKALLPWRIRGYTFSPEKETVWSCRYIEKHLLPPGKRCRILLWSGNCLPDGETLRVCEEAGLLNMNGGDARFDGEYPSYIYVTPLYRQVGKYYQIHSSNSNENTYTDLWTGPFGGYQNVIQTFLNTETPRRVSPIDVYYHFYSGERPAGLHALKVAYGWVSTQEIFPVYASRYIEIVHGFISARIEQLGEGVWRISDNGACRTVRFDGCARYPDLEKSEGVLGFLHHQNSLYVHLNESPEHILALMDTEPIQPFLEMATADVDSLRWGADGRFSFRTSAFGKAAYAWRNLTPNADYAIRLYAEGGVRTISARTDSSGLLNVSVAFRGPAEATVTPVGDGRK